MDTLGDYPLSGFMAPAINMRSIHRPSLLQRTSMRADCASLSRTALVCFFICVALLVVAYLRYKLPRSWFINSDVTFLPTLYRDLFLNEGTLSNWSLSAAPYFIPDWPLYFGACALTNGPYLATCAFMVTQVLLTFLLTAAVYRTVWRNLHDARLAAATITVVLLSLTIGITRHHYQFMLFSVFHYGTFLLILSGLLILLRAMWSHAADHNNAPWKHFLTLTALTLAASLSDALFVVQFSAAATLALSYLWLRRFIPTRFTVTGLLAITVGSVFGSVLYKFVVPHPTRPSARVHLHAMEAKGRVLYDFFVPAAQEQPLLAFLLVTFYALVLLHVAEKRRPRLNQTAAEVCRHFVAMFTLGLMLFPMTAVIVIASIQTIPSRYIIPFFFAPIVLGPLLMTHEFLQRRSNIVRLSATAVCLLLMLNYARFSLSGPGKLHWSYYPERVRCMDNAIAAHNLRWGIADYWDAKRLALLSRQSATLASVTPMLYEYFFINTNRVFHDSYDFAIVSPAAVGPERLTEATIIQHNGPPLHTVLCDGPDSRISNRDDSPVKLLIYPPGGLHALQSTP